MLKTVTAQKMEFSIKNFFSKCDQIRSLLRIWSHLLKKSLMKIFVVCTVLYVNVRRSSGDIGIQNFVLGFVIIKAICG